jgi:hypothetical protein
MAGQDSYFVVVEYLGTAPLLHLNTSPSESTRIVYSLPHHGHWPSNPRFYQSTNSRAPEAARRKPTHPLRCRSSQVSHSSHDINPANVHQREKEFKEYKELERSRSKKWMAKVIPGLSSSLDKSKLKEASEWQEAQAAENKQRDLVNRLDDNIRALNKMVRSSSFLNQPGH